MTEKTFERVKEYFQMQFENCTMYREYCLNCGFKAQDLQGPDDVKRIPLIPTGMFKNNKLLSVPEPDIVKTCTSSGTNGGRSMVYRDKQTLQAVYDNIDCMTDDLLSKEFSEYEMYCLGPVKEEAKDLWFAYIMGLIEGIPKLQRFFVKDQKFQLQELIKQLKEDEVTQKKIMIIGPPMFFQYLTDALGENTISLNPDCITMTMGGWKKFQGEAISREELDAKIVKALGIRKENTRDGYSSVEINTALYECSNKRKHVPEWLYVEAVDPDTLEPVPYGEEGVLVFIDTTAKSFPCLVISEDFGIVYQGSDCCGMNTDYIKITRRVASVESKGCALKLNESEVN